MFMNRMIFVLIFILIFATTALSFIFPYIYNITVGEGVSMKFYLIMCFCGLAIHLVMKYFKNKYAKEYDLAHKASYTPKNKYGLFALLFVVIFVVSFIVYVCMV